MLDALLIGLIFILAGFVKGVAGFGLPTVSIALIALLKPIPEAIGLMLVPAFVTNIWQGLAGGRCGTAHCGFPVLRGVLHHCGGLAFIRGGWPFSVWPFGAEPFCFGKPGPAGAQYASAKPRA